MQYYINQAFKITKTDSAYFIHFMSKVSFYIDI